VHSPARGSVVVVHPGALVGDSTRRRRQASAPVPETRPREGNRRCSPPCGGLSRPVTITSSVPSAHPERPVPAHHVRFSGRSTEGNSKPPNRTADSRASGNRAARSATRPPLQAHPRRRARVQSSDQRATLVVVLVFGTVSGRFSSRCGLSRGLRRYFGVPSLHRPPTAHEPVETGNEDEHASGRWIATPASPLRQARSSATAVIRITRQGHP
jgi:hypothetical protein